MAAASGDATTANATRTGRHPSGKSRKGVKKIRRSEEHARHSSRRSRASMQQRLGGRASTPEEPWSQFFPTYQGYCLARLGQECDMSERQADGLIHLIRSCMSGRGVITLSDYFEAGGAHPMFAGDSELELGPYRSVLVSPMRISMAV